MDEGQVFQNQEVVDKIIKDKAMVETVSIVQEIQDLSDFLGDISLAGVPDFEIALNQDDFEVIIKDDNYYEIQAEKAKWEKEKEQLEAKSSKFNSIEWLFLPFAIMSLVSMFTFWLFFVFGAIEGIGFAGFFFCVAMGFLSLSMADSLAKNTHLPKHPVYKYTKYDTKNYCLQETLKQIVELSEHEKMSSRKGVLSDLAGKYMKLIWLADKAKEEADSLNESIKVGGLIGEDVSLLKDKQLDLRGIVDKVLLYDSNVSQRISDVTVLVNYSGDRIKLTSDNIKKVADQLMLEVDTLLKNVEQAV